LWKKREERLKSGLKRIKWADEEYVEQVVKSLGQENLRVRWCYEPPLQAID